MELPWRLKEEKLHAESTWNFDFPSKYENIDAVIVYHSEMMLNSCSLCRRNLVIDNNKITAA